MTRDQLVEILESIGTLLELKGENPFKSRAYSSAARTLETCPEDPVTLAKEGRIGELKGIGGALQEKITTLVITGTLPYYEELRASIPAGLLDLLDIPGLGPKRIKLLHEKLGIQDLAGLEFACQNGSIATLAGFGEKSVQNILAGIGQRRRFSSQFRYADVIHRAEELVDILRTHPDITRVAVAGSLRRCKEVVKDLDLIASSKKPGAVMDAFVDLDGVERVLGHGETKSSVILEGGVQCDLRVVPDAQFAPALHHFTGSKEHNVAMRQRAIARGFKLSEWGLFPKTDSVKEDDETAEPLKIRSEEELFQKLGLDFIPPELREGAGEIEAAEDHRLPRLIEWTQLKGCFHNHTRASDGHATLEEMAEAAADLGLDYLGLADHSKSSFQANGLSEERLLAQAGEIRAFNKTRKEIHLFAGVECDILNGGKLDFEDGILAQLDYVVASVHAGFTQDEETMTARIIKAIENPHVTMLGHLTGRLLLRREPYAVNVPKILEAAAATGTWIELNANPHRLDMDWRWWRRARDLGVKCVINPDAHRTSHLQFLRLGINIARKGWLEAKDVMNTLPLDEVAKALRAKRG
jgi:DNA polymerase (family 10)